MIMPISMAVYRAICQTLTDRADRVAWGAFTPEDWAGFAATAQAEGVAPLLHRKLRGIKLPQATAAALHTAYYQTLAQNTLLFAELNRILAALAQAGIPVIVLKGAALVATVYGQAAPGTGLALRPMGDLDVLVRERALYRAVRTVEALGYVEIYPEVGPGLARLLSHHIHLRKADHHRVAVEIHKNIVASEAHWYAVPVDWFWEHLQPYPPVQVGGSVVSGATSAGAHLFSPEAQLLHLAAHAALQHGVGQAQLLWLYDIDRWIRAHAATLDWAMVSAQAKSLRWKAAVYAAVARTQRLFATPLPDGVLPDLARNQHPATREMVTHKARIPRTRFQSQWQTLRSLTWPVRLRLAVALVFPSRAYMQWRYRPTPGWLWPLYYPYRWGDVGRDVLRTVVAKHP